MALKTIILNCTVNAAERMMMIAKKDLILLWILLIVILLILMVILGTCFLWQGSLLMTIFDNKDYPDDDAVDVVDGFVYGDT